MVIVTEKYRHTASLQYLPSKSHGCFGAELRLILLDLNFEGPLQKEIVSHRLQPLEMFIRDIWLFVFGKNVPFFPIIMVQFMARSVAPSVPSVNTPPKKKTSHGYPSVLGSCCPSLRTKALIRCAKGATSTLAANCRAMKWSLAAASGSPSEKRYTKCWGGTESFGTLCFEKNDAT